MQYCETRSNTRKLLQNLCPANRDRRSKAQLVRCAWPAKADDALPRTAKSYRKPVSVAAARKKANSSAEDGQPEINKSRHDADRFYLQGVTASTRVLGCSFAPAGITDDQLPGAVGLAAKHLDCLVANCGRP
jgi:hypothetical protein